MDKIFISYSWLDKRFIRRLVARLEKEGYHTWLDEKELTPGDRLSSKLAEAIERSKIVIIVISENSIKSNWLKFEMELATRRMVEEHVRLIPVLKGKVAVPEQLRGLVYADFRTNSRDGYKKLLNAIEDELPKALESSSFWTQIQYLLEEVFDHKTSMSIISDKKSFHYRIVEIHNIPEFDEELTIPYVIIPSYEMFGSIYSGEIVKREFRFDHEEIDHPYFLSIYETRGDQDHFGSNRDRITVSELDSPFLDLSQYEVSIDMNGLTTLGDRRMALQEVKGYFIEHTIAHKKEFGSLT